MTPIFKFTIGLVSVLIFALVILGIKKLIEVFRNES